MLDELPVGVPTPHAVPGYPPALVVHADASIERAIVYLHGKCGRIEKLTAWSKVVSRHATVIGIRARVPCGNGGTARWSRNITALDEYIQEVLGSVRKRRDGHLASEELILFGYSQGATRAQSLHALRPTSYPWLILGGPPGVPKVNLLSTAETVVLLRGELEGSWHVRQGQVRLRQAGVPVVVDVFPGAGHGEFGPEGSEVLDRVIQQLR